MQRIFFKGANAQLSAVMMGQEDKPPILVLHGLRDHALGLSEFLVPLSEHFHVIAMDLRGHGHSDKVQTYTMVQFMADLGCLYSHFNLDRAIVVGHSLGGHIAMRFAATYPEKVEKLILLDGMGPPGSPDGIEAEDIQGRLRFHIETAEQITGIRKPMVDTADAKQRLMRNNPLMSEQLAEIIVSEGTEPHEGGGVMWRWESAVNMVWATFSHAETETIIKLIACPVLIVTGTRGMEYWTTMRPELNDPPFYASELKRREALFQDARHVVIDDAGHMLHYDQPKALFEVVAAFLS